MTTQTFIYVSCAGSRQIDVFALDADSGAVTLRQRVPTPGSPMPLFSSLHGPRLYVGTCSEDALLAYSIDTCSGELSWLGGMPSPGVPTYVSCDAARRAAFVASYHGNLLATYPLDDKGVPVAPCRVEQALPRAHAALTDRSNRWLLVPLLGADEIRIFVLAGDGRITLHSVAKARAGSGPRHLVISADNRDVYCLNELDGTVDHYAFDAVRGELRQLNSESMLPTSACEAPWAAELRASPDGRLLFATDRRSSTLAVLSTEPPEGHPVLLGSYPTETQPRGMAIDPSGRWLVVAGQLSGHLTVYEVDRHSGQLQARHRQTTGENPICIEIVSPT